MNQLLAQIYIVYTSLKRPLDRKIFVIGMVAAVVITVIVVGQMKRARDQANAPPTLVAMGAIAPDSIVSATLGEREEHVWDLTGQKGDRFTLQLFGNWHRTLMLTYPGGDEWIAQSTGATGDRPAFIENIGLPTDGTYGVIVRGKDGEAGHTKWMSAGSRRPAHRLGRCDLGEAEC